MSNKSGPVGNSIASAIAAAEGGNIIESHSHTPDFSTSQDGENVEEIKKKLQDPVKHAEKVREINARINDVNQRAETLKIRDRIPMVSDGLDTDGLAVAISLAEGQIKSLQDQEMVKEQLGELEEVGMVAGVMNGIASAVEAGKRLVGMGAKNPADVAGDQYFSDIAPGSHKHSAHAGEKSAGGKHPSHS